MRVILHIGTPKTATTTIQDLLSGNRAWLQRRGYFYPQIADARRSHNKIANSLASADSANLDAVRSELFDSAPPDGTMVVSAEALSVRITGEQYAHWHGFGEDYEERKRDYVNRIGNLFRDAKSVSVHVCFRRHDEYAAALYSTNTLADRFRWSFVEFRERCAPLFDYAAQLAAFREVFDNVNIISFDDLRQDVKANFFRWTGIPEPPPCTTETNATPDARLVHWAYQRSESDPDNHALRIKFVRSRRAAQSIQSAGSSTLWADDRQRQDFLSQCTEPAPGFFPAKTDTRQLAAPFMGEAEQKAVDAAFSTWKRTRAHL